MQPSAVSLPGLGHESSRVVLTQAVLEGVSFALRDSLEALRAAGTKLSRVTAIGGGSRSRYWLKSIATALGLPVDIPADGDFGAAFGAARLGLVAATKADPLSVFTAPGDRRNRSARRVAARRPTRMPISAIAGFIPRSGPPTDSNRRFERQEEHLMSTGFFGDIAKIKYEGPDSTNPLAFRHYKPGRDRPRQADGRSSALSPSPTGTPSPGRAATPSAARRSCVPGSKTR